MIDVSFAAVTAVLHLAVVGVVVTPLIWLRARRSNLDPLTPRGGRLLLCAAGMYVALVCVWSLPRVAFFAELTWNWQNKLLVFVLLLLAVWRWSGLTWRELGVRRPLAGWWIPALGLPAAMTGMNLLGGPEMPTDAETFAFQAIVPGLDEEFFFRGVLLLVLFRAFSVRRRKWGTDVGWEVPISCMLFGLGHGLYVDPGWVLQVDAVPIMLTALFGYASVWIRLRWDSLIPVVLAHNAANVGAVFVNTL